MIGIKGKEEALMYKTNICHVSCTFAKVTDTSGKLLKWGWTGQALYSSKHEFCLNMRHHNILLQTAKNKGQ